MSDYDSPYEEAKRLMLCFSDREDTQERLASLIPELLKEIEELQITNDELRIASYED